MFEGDGIVFAFIPLNHMSKATADPAESLSLTCWASNVLSMPTLCMYAEATSMPQYLLKLVVRICALLGRVYKNSCSSRSARDVEPLVDAGVDGSRRLVFTLRDVELARVDAVGAVGDCDVGAFINVSQSTRKSVIA